MLCNAMGVINKKKKTARETLCLLSSVRSEARSNDLSDDVLYCVHRGANKKVIERSRSVMCT